MPRLKEHEGGKHKPANYGQEYTPDQLNEINRCVNDPVYFIKKYVRLQHPVQGSLPFNLFAYQEKMVRFYEESHYAIAMLPRQCGKCVTSLISITKNLNKVKIGSLVPMNFRERVITWLDEIKVGLALYVKRKSQEERRG